MGAARRKCRCNFLVWGRCTAAREARSWIVPDAAAILDLETTDLDG